MLNNLRRVEGVLVVTVGQRASTPYHRQALAFPELLSYVPHYVLHANHLGPYAL
jgi:hypothetical protein